MKTLSKALTELIACAEDIVLRPAILPPRPTDSFLALAAELRAAASKPAEGERATYAAMVMIPAIEAFFAQERVDHHYQMIIASTLFVLRIDAALAFKNEREEMRAS